MMQAFGKLVRMAQKECLARLGLTCIPFFMVLQRFGT